MAGDQDELRALVCLTLCPGVGPVLCDRLVRQFGSARVVLEASEQQLERIERIGPRTRTIIVRGLREVGPRADEELELAHAAGVAILARSDERYPTRLREIPSAPPLLFVRGDVAVLHRPGLAIVGSRRCSSYGIEQAERFAAALARSGMSIVSGGARGVDTAAHRAALRAEGATVAVLGCGLSRAYPPENAELFDRIAALGGAVVSELPMRTPPSAENFPARNRIISGLSSGVLVVEAGDRSGALITARLAGDEHGREVFALPGRVDQPASRGSNDLLKQGGALLVTEPTDISDRLGGLRAVGVERGGEESALFAAAEPDDPLRRGVLAALDAALTPDELVERTGLAADQVRVTLTMLELEGRIRRTGTRVERR